MIGYKRADRDFNLIYEVKEIEVDWNKAIGHFWVYPLQTHKRDLYTFYKIHTTETKCRSMAIQFVRIDCIRITSDFTEKLNY